VAFIVQLTAPIFSIFGQDFSWRDLILIAGGLFLVWKATKEIHHSVDRDHGPDIFEGRATLGFSAAIGQILILDLVFSIDSIITAVGMARHVEIMIVAVIIAMIVMFLFSDKISNFIHKHPTLKMLALSFLLMVGFSLFFEGLEPIHGNHIDKGYIYFAMAFSFGVEMLNMRMKRKSVPVALHEPIANKED
jgi:predicted tellurium resistance membrane protein TerC